MRLHCGVRAAPEADVGSIACGRASHHRLRAQPQQRSSIAARSTRLACVLGATPLARGKLMSSESAFRESVPRAASCPTRVAVTDLASASPFTLAQQMRCTQRTASAMTRRPERASGCS